MYLLQYLDTLAVNNKSTVKNVVVCETLRAGKRAFWTKVFTLLRSYGIMLNDTNTPDDYMPFVNEDIIKLCKPYITMTDNKDAVLECIFAKRKNSGTVRVSLYIIDRK